MADDIERVRQAALKDPTQLVRFADLLIASGRAEEAVTACRKGLGTRPDDVPLRLALGRALSAAGHLEEAQAALLDAVVRQQRAQAAPAAPAQKAEQGGAGLFGAAVVPDSGPVIEDPSVEEVIELPTTVGNVPGVSQSGVPAPDRGAFDDEGPTSIGGSDELIAARSARRPTMLGVGTNPSPSRPQRAPGPRTPERVTALPERNATGPVGVRDSGAPSEAVGRGTDPGRVRRDTPAPLPLEPAPPRDAPVLRLDPGPRRDPSAPRASDSASRRAAAGLRPTVPAVAPGGPTDRSARFESRPANAVPSVIDLRASAHALLGETGGDDLPVPDMVAPVPDEMTRAWDARRGRAFVWLWVALVLLSGGIAGGYVYRARERARLLAIAVERADARALEASAEGDFAARDAYAGALRAEPKLRKYTAMVALAAARLAADHGEDTDAAAWAMLKRAEKEATHKLEPDPRAERELRQARGLLALARGENCPPLEEKEDGDIVARCALQRGDTDAARRILGQSIKNAGDIKNARALLALASLELGAGDLDAADAAYGKVLAGYPGHPRATVGRLMVSIERGELPKIPELPAGGARQGLTTEAWFHLAKGLVFMNEQGHSLEDASAELDLARRGITHDGRLALLYGRARLLQGKVAEAEQAMRVAERLNPNDADVAVLDAEVALAKGYEDKVVAALSVGTQTPRKLAVLGRAQALTARYREAAATLDAALAKRPGDAVSITYRAIARAHLGDPAGAQRELEKAASTLSSPTPRYGLGLLAYERRDLARARVELEKALAGQNGESFRARALLGRVLRDLGKTKEALAELERVAREAPALTPVHSALGRLYLDVGRDREARAELRLVIDAGSPTPDDRLAYAEAVVRLGMADQAGRAIDEAVEAGIPAARVATLRLELQSWKGAKEALVAARALDKERKGPLARDAKLTLATANAFRRAGDYKRASELFGEALLGDSLHANLGIGRIQLAQNDTGGAESSFRSALEAARKQREAGTASLDDETEARLGLGRALLARKAASEAQQILEAAVEKDAGSAEAHYYLARACQDKNELDKALPHAERAVAIDDAYADAWALLGDLTKARTPDRARTAYKKYLELTPEGDRAKAVKKALGALK